MMGPSAFFAYAREREEIRRRRVAGCAPPWTNDPALQRWTFCNVYREDDKTTAWFREHVRQPLRNRDPYVIAFAAYLFRWFNRIETGRLLLAADLFELWDHRRARETLRNERPLVTGAYVIKTPNGLNKLEGIIKCVEQTLAGGHLSKMAEASTLQVAHAILCEAPFMGPFMAYEVVTDLRHTRVLHKAPDICTWASAGPGAARGLDWVFGGQTRHYGSPECQARMQQEMQALLEESRWITSWPFTDKPAWEMREVEHTLCEFDKYMRALSGGQLKRRFHGGQYAGLAMP